MVGRDALASAPNLSVRLRWLVGGGRESGHRLPTKPSCSTTCTAVKHYIPKAGPEQSSTPSPNWTTLHEDWTVEGAQTLSLSGLFARVSILPASAKVS